MLQRADVLSPYGRLPERLGNAACSGESGHDDQVKPERADARRAAFSSKGAMRRFPAPQMAVTVTAVSFTSGKPPCVSMVPVSLSLDQHAV